MRQLYGRDCEVDFVATHLYTCNAQYLQWCAAAPHRLFLSAFCRKPLCLLREQQQSRFWGKAALLVFKKYLGVEEL